MQNQFKFFIVDDDVFCAKMHEQYLLNLNYSNITCFSNGNDCLNNLNQNPDIIFLDHKMDGITGLGILKKIKRFTLTLSFIMLTVVFANAQVQKINAVISSSVNTAVTGALTFGTFASQTDIETGLISDPVTFAVKSNRLWKVNTAITSITGTPILGGVMTTPLPPQNIAWGVIDGSAGTVSTFTPFGSTLNTATEIKTGDRGISSVTGNTFTLRYKIVPGSLADLGTYAVTATHTISAL
jgi:CheY-like chemotaxis protein